MEKTQNDSKFCPPDYEIEAFARCLLPEIQRFFDSEQGQREFREWKEQKKDGNDIGK